MSNSNTAEIVRGLIAERQRNRADSEIGCVCSNLIEIIENMQGYERPAWATHEMQSLPHMAKWQAERLERIRGYDL